MRSILTVSHSYVVALNRKLAAELASVGQGQWRVTVVAPTFFKGDLRAVELEHGDIEPYELIPLRVHNSRSLHTFVYEWKLREIIHRGWDVVHCWEEPYVAAGAQIAAFTPDRTPLVFSTLQNLRKTYPPPFAQMERYSLSRASGWIAMGQTVASVLRDRPEYRALPWKTIPMGVGMERFQASPEEGAATRRSLGWGDSGAPIVGFLGRFVEEKGLDLLMRALDACRSSWRALFVGGGPLEGALRAWARRRPDAVRIVTGVHHDAVPAYLNAMDMICAPSQTSGKWKEQFGRMIIEAFACRVPVIGSDSGEIPYTVGDAGLIVGECDVDGWTAAIERLLESGELRCELGDRGHARAEERFAWSSVARETLSFFGGLTERRAQRNREGAA